MKKLLLVFLVANLFGLLAYGCNRDGAELSQHQAAHSCGMTRAPLSLSTAAECAAPGVAGASGKNPCDPGCRVFRERPTTSLSADGGHNWQIGRPSDLSAEAYTQGLSQCETGADCQFNSSCVAPASGTCSHGVCEEGQGLRDGCSDCASIVCAADASCCESEPAPTCEHDLCQVGIALSLGCDSCVDSICGDPTTAHCCDEQGEWDQQCVDAVTTTCGATCGCGSGEVEIAGRCYLESATPRTWERALLDCRQRGAGWDLVSIDDGTENAAVAAIGSGTRWLGFFDAGSGSSGPAGALSAFASSEKPGNGPGFAMDGYSSTSWTVESPLFSNVQVTANDSQSGHPPLDAIDGDNGSYWAAESANASDGKFVTIELDSLVSLEELTIRWKNAHSRQFDFEILAGTDISSLSSVYSRGLSTLLASPGSETYDVTDGTVSVIRIVAYGNTGSGWNSIEEIVIPGVTYSFTRGAQSITFELATSYLVEEVSLEWDNDNTDFEIWVGDTLETLALAYTGDNGSDRSLVDYDIADTQGRLVQIRAFGNSGNRWNNLEEFDFDAAGLSSGSWKWTSHDPATTWIESTMTGGYANWAGGEPSGDECGVIRSDGSWQSGACSDTQVYVCEGPPGHLEATPGVWSSSCVAQAESLCHVQCDSGAPSRADGACIAWAPGDVDADCADVDLAVGVPCDDVIPVCNHGTVDAPAGVEVVHFDPGAQTFGAPSADPLDASATSCTTTDVIPAGECIELSGCISAAAGTREIMVNPEGSVTECSTSDNWAIFESGVSCDTPYCGGSSTTSEKPKVDIIIFVDNSSSMENEIDAIEASLNTDFAEVIGDSGLDYRVIMLSRFARVGESVYGTYFPICIGPPLGNEACTDTSVEFELTPPFYPFSNDSESEDAWCDVLASFSQADETAPADEARAWPTLSPQGWSEWLREDAFKSFIVFTDDEVKCSFGGRSWRDNDNSSDGMTVATQFDAELLALSPEHFGTSADRKYVWHSVVGMIGNTSSGSVAPWQPADSIRTSRCGSGADAAGTGHQALSRLTGGLRYPICNTSDFDTIFQEVAAAVVDTSSTPCDYELNHDGDIDLSATDVTIRATDSGTGVENVLSLSRVTDAASCVSDDYYFDDNSNPTQLTLCPGTCAAAQATVGQELQVLVELGCAEATSATFTETYQAECPTGMHPLWTMITYDSEIDGDGSIEFSVRSGMDLTQLAAASFASARVATTANPACGLGCGAQLDTVLASEDWGDEFLELMMEITPSSGGISPQLHEWEVRYSCQDRE